MGVANIPYPSFTLVLTSSRVVIPTPSSARVLPQMPPRDFMTTVHYNDRVVEELNFLWNLRNEMVATEKPAEGGSDTTSAPVTEESEYNIGLHIGETIASQSKKTGPARFFLKTVETFFKRRTLTLTSA